MLVVQVYSILIVVFLLMIFYFQRKIIISWSTISVFFVSNFIFVLLGLLILPFVFPYIGQGYFFQGLNTKIITEDDIIKAILLVSSGNLIVLYSYKITGLILKGRSVIKGPNLLGSPQFIWGAPQKRIYTVGSLLLVLTLVLLIPKLNVILGGIEALIKGSPTGVIDARQAITSNYILVILIYNIIPFFAVGTWISHKLNSNIFSRIYSYSYIFIAALLLFLMFQKRPLVLFLMCLFLASIWVSRAKYLALYKRIKKISKIKLIFSGISILLVLMILYFLMTKVGRGPDSSIFETLKILLFLVLSRLLGRLSLPSVMYSHYFPSIDPYYTFNNIGLVSKLFNFELYRDTPIIFEYFYNYEGSVAISALMDFYGGFGIIGLLIGANLLGMGLFMVDYLLSNLNKSGSNFLLIIFAFFTVFYLSQASLPRSLMGYGGVFFFMFWIIIKLRVGQIKR